MHYNSRLSRARQCLLVGLLATVSVAAVSCRTAYYSTMERVGIHKRDILVDRVEDARDSQETATEEFKDALTLFTEVVDIKGAGGLEKKYSRLNKAFEKSEARAADVHRRINKIESVAKALFKEWKSENKQYTNPQLRKISEDKYRHTLRKHDDLMDTMKSAAAKMDPVLAAFKDQVLFLKHNLNSRAIAAIKGESQKIQSDVKALIRDMEASVAEADSFIKEMANGE